jgi:hypothetical protein
MGRFPHWVKVKNPKAPAVTREAEEDWGGAKLMAAHKPACFVRQLFERRRKPPARPA